MARQFGKGECRKHTSCNCRLAHGKVEQLLLKSGIESQLKMKRGIMHINFATQRKSNSEGHTMDNCVAYCKNCNCAASNKMKV